MLSRVSSVVIVGSVQRFLSPACFCAHKDAALALRRPTSRYSWQVRDRHQPKTTHHVAA